MKKSIILVSGTNSLNFYLEDEEFQFEISFNCIYLFFKTRHFTIDKTLCVLTLSEGEKKLINDYYEDNGLDDNVDLESILKLDFFKHLKVNLLTNLSTLLHKALYANQSTIYIDTLFNEVLEEFERDLKNEFKVHF
ncbi:hypothetical protein CAV_0595 [Campylobacter avium LMG 24591]|uniref:Uncharacterized protein n=1 Tax=Campylobacter avium LMG 24591 TaxID=522484 RepID=A0A222MXF5_9BACT|nr:hypothetical protein [Campylobacter avium]ASQ30262.1 hypothetical protein CAV_0595 [Campylobacter avium LMG 24591]OYD79360.1 hypothetical protein CAV8706_0597 [Campylobacter avium]